MCSQQYDNTIRGYFDDDGLLMQWPNKRKKKLLVLQYLASKFESGTEFSEEQVNEILKNQMSYNDHVLIRRELYNNHFLERTRDGRKYWKSKTENPSQ